MNAWSTAATGVPGTLMLVDLQGYWPGISNNTTSAQTLVGTPSLRYANGAGCRLYWVQTWRLARLRRTSPSPTPTRAAAAKLCR